MFELTRQGESVKETTMQALREHNREALRDFLDGVIPAFHPGSPDPEQPYDDSGKGESRVLLKEAQYKRLERPAEKRSLRQLERLMIAPDSRLAREHRTEYSALVQFVFGAPAGYQAILDLEMRAARGDPLAPEPAEYCRGGFEHVLGYLETKGYELVVPVVERLDSRKHAVVDRRRERARAAFSAEYAASGNGRAAVQAAMEAEGYRKTEAYELTADLR